MSIIEIHSRLANSALLYIAILALWSLWRFFRRQEVDSSYRGALLVAEILILAQGALGAYLFFSGIGHLARGYMHILYGVISALVIPGLFLFVREEQRRSAMMVNAAALLFLAALLLRAMATGGAG